MSQHLISISSPHSAVTNHSLPTKLRTTTLMPVVSPFQNTLSNLQAPLPEPRPVDNSRLHTSSVASFQKRCHVALTSLTRRRQRVRPNIESGKRSLEFYR